MYYLVFKSTISFYRSFLQSFFDLSFKLFSLDPSFTFIRTFFDRLFKLCSVCHSIRLFLSFILLRDQLFCLIIHSNIFLLVLHSFGFSLIIHLKVCLSVLHSNFPSTVQIGHSCKLLFSFNQPRSPWSDHIT